MRTGGFDRKVIHRVVNLIPSEKREKENHPLVPKLSTPWGCERSHNNPSKRLSSRWATVKYDENDTTGMSGRSNDTKSFISHSSSKSVQFPSTTTANAFQNHIMSSLQKKITLELKDTTAKVQHLTHSILTKHSSPNSHAIPSKLKTLEVSNTSPFSSTRVAFPNTSASSILPTQAQLQSHHQSEILSNLTHTPKVAERRQQEKNAVDDVVRQKDEEIETLKRQKHSLKKTLRSLQKAMTTAYFDLLMEKVTLMREKSALREEIQEISTRLVSVDKSFLEYKFGHEKQEQELIRRVNSYIYDTRKLLSFLETSVKSDEEIISKNVQLLEFIKNEVKPTLACEGVGSTDPFSRSRQLDSAALVNVLDATPRRSNKRMMSSTPPKVVAPDIEEREEPKTERTEQKMEKNCNKFSVLKELEPLGTFLPTTLGNTSLAKCGPKRNNEGTFSFAADFVDN